jgi:uncharacterized protein
MSSERSLFSKLLQWTAILAMVYICFAVLLYALQDRLIFFPGKTTDKRWTALIEELRADYMSIRANDGAVLEGMLLHDHSGEPRKTVLFFAGNATQVSEYARDFARLPARGVNVLLMDYRGYGLSTGKPSAEAMKSDAEKVFDAAASHPYVDPESMIAWGYSVGTGVAVHLAAAKTVERVILFSPFTSSLELARRSFPFMPVSLLLRHKFDNLLLAKRRAQPVLIVHGAEDNQLSPKQSERMVQAWGSLSEEEVPKELHIAEGRGHNGLLIDEKVWNRVERFLASDL